MNKHRTRDKIDEELSKTYFGNTLRTIDLKGSAVSPVKNTSPSPEKDLKKRSSDRFKSFLADTVVIIGRLRSFFIAITVLALLVLSIIWFLANEQLMFNIKIETTPLSGKPAPSTAVVKPSSVSARNIPGKEKILYDFESGDEGWEIPFWATEKADHIASSMDIVKNISSSGKHSARIYANFVPGIWSAALIENQHFLNLTNYGKISVKIYLPPDAIERLRGEIILTIGNEWRFVEMSRSVKLYPGKWTTIAADISPGSLDWKRIQVDDAFRKDIRKIALRITSNGEPYSGFIYVDEVKVSP